MDIFNDKRILSVSRLTALIRSTLEDNFEHIWVEGEVSNLATPSSGHIYFTLKDSTAQIRSVMFRGAAKALRFRLVEGMSLIIRGRLTVYEQRGDYQLLAEYAEPQGLGALQLAFEQLKARLDQDGLFAASRKRKLPLLPQRIGIVTSPTGAAIYDILTVINRRFANVHILINPVRVQGDGAAAEIASAIDDFNRYGEVDVMIVGRGGGSLEDLWAFNEECVARAIARSRVPVISAVGHEIDVTISDFVADLRAATPSAAAEMVVQSKQDLVSRVDELNRQLRRDMEQILRGKWSEFERQSHSLKDPSLLVGNMIQRLDDISCRLRMAMNVLRGRRLDRLDAVSRHIRALNPAIKVERCREHLIAVTARLDHGLRQLLARHHETVAVQSSRLDALSPLHTLARGYAVARTFSGHNVIRDVSQLAGGDRLELVLYKGRAVCRVEEMPVELSPESC